METKRLGARIIHNTLVIQLDKFVARVASKDRIHVSYLTNTVSFVCSVTVIELHIYFCKFFFIKLSDLSFRNLQGPSQHQFQKWLLALICQFRQFFSFAACLYGDGASWCSTIKAHTCYTESLRCCQKCKNFTTNIPSKDSQ